jgi:hypothetical protein
MFVIHGVYHWFPRRVAFRNDFCLACAAPRRAVQTSTLDVVHLFWVPLVPIGRWKRWSCTICGKRPDEIVKTRRIFKVAGLVLLMLFTAVVWMVPGMPDEPGVWAVRVVTPLAAVATAIHLMRSSSDDRGYKPRQRQVVPADDAICPFCGTPLFSAHPDCYCPGCQVMRL